MQAIILAGGFGTRLRPLTISLPKPMAPVANKPMMEHVVNLCAEHGFKDLLTMLHYSPADISGYFGTGRSWGVSFSYLKPDLDLGTAGCIRFAADRPEGQGLHREPFMVISGDVLTDFNLKKAWQFHNDKKSAATIVLTRVQNPLPYGVVLTDDAGRITRFLEKPTWGEVFSDTINTGIYFLSPEVLKFIPENESFDFSKNLFPKLMEQGLPVHGYIADGYWKDIGDLTEYRLSHVDILDDKVKLELDGKPLKDHPNVIAGEKCEIEEGAKFEGKVILGKNCKIAAGAHITQSVIGERVTIGSGASIRKSVIWSRSSIGQEAALREAVIGEGVRVGARARIEVGAIVANLCQVGADAVIKPSVKMWPEKRLEEGAVLSSSLVWGERWTKQLFGNFGITGLANVEITPELAAKFGAAYGAFLGQGRYVITSRDAHKTSRLLKRALISGLLSSGVRVGDLRMIPLPVMRYEMGKEGESGGVHIRLSPFDPRQVDIRVFDIDGSDLPVVKEKAVEQLFMREDFKRASVNDVGELTVPPQAQEYYKTGFLKNINAGIFQGRRLKVVIDYSHSTASMILPDLLGAVGIESMGIYAHVSTTRVTRTEEEFKNALKELSNIVTTLKADAGFLMDNGAEKLFIVDENGQIVPPAEALVLVGLLSIQSGNQDVIAYPVHGPSVLEEIATSRGLTVLQTPVNPRHILEFARRPNVGFVGDGEGGFIFPKFQPAFDAMFAIARITEMLAQQETTLGQARKLIPKPIHLLHKQVPCSWAKKGQVMRLAQDTSKGHKIELLDGVKIHQPDGWVLVLPDGDEAYCHVWAESSSEKAAKQVLNEYAKKVDEWQEKGTDGSEPEEETKGKEAHPARPGR